MSADTPAEAATRGPQLTNHAIERWIERVCHHHADVCPWDLPDAFAEAVSVGIPGSGRGRLHAPTGSVIVYKRDWSAGPPVLVTVLDADFNALNDDHLDRCPDCGFRYNAGVAPCPWCTPEGI